MKPATPAPQCCKRVYSGASWDMMGHRCSRKGIVQDGDKWYCNTHSPEAVKAKQEKWDAEFKAQMAASEAIAKRRAEDSRRAAAYPRLVEALLEFTTAAEAGILWDSAADRDFVDSRQSQQAINLLRELGEIQSMNKPLTWDELAEFYDAANGGRRARTLPMDQVFEWAEKQTDKFQITEDGGIVLK